VWKNVRFHFCRVHDFSTTFHDQLPDPRVFRCAQDDDDDDYMSQTWVLTPTGAGGLRWPGFALSAVRGFNGLSIGTARSRVPANWRQRITMKQIDHINWRAPRKNRTSRYISFFHPSLNGVLVPMFCLVMEGECQILMF